MSEYDPVQCLREEVDRFKATNQFTPMLVTGFYLQAACVLTELENARKRIELLTKRVAYLEKENDRMETVLLELPST